jgi:hypothetical protein
MSAYLVQNILTVNKQKCGGKGLRNTTSPFQKQAVGLSLTEEWLQVAESYEDQQQWNLVSPQMSHLPSGCHLAKRSLYK